MRRSSHDIDFIRNEDGGELIGVNLGWDHTAEHEWGLGRIENEFGLPKGPSRSLFKRVVGLNARTISKVPTGLKLIFDPKRNYTYLVYMPHYRWPKDGDMPKYLDDVMEIYRDVDVAAAWSGGSGGGDFGVRVKTDDERGYLQEIYNALQKKDAVIFLSGRNNPFANSGLVIAIKSAVPKDIAEGFAKADIDRMDLVDAAKATGIHDRLEKARRKYYALSPAWASSIKSTKDGEVKTAHKVIFFLNPQDQRAYDCGWYTVEQLDMWVKGEGPIVMNKKSKSA